MKVKPNNEWVPIPQHENYAANRNGCIKNLITGKILPESKTVKLDNMVLCRYTIIAKLFVPNPHHMSAISYKDGDPTNICADNLYWTDPITFGTYTREDVKKIFDTVLKYIECKSEFIAEKCNVTNIFLIERFKKIIEHMRNETHPTFEELISDFHPLKYKDTTFTRYQINKYGIILNTITDRLVLGSASNNTYFIVSLSHNGKKYKIGIHRLLADTFLPKIPGCRDVNHINGLKFDPCLCNLERITHAGNIQHAYNINLREHGDKFYNNRYTEQQIHDVCKLLCEESYSPKQICGITGVSVDAINQIRRGEMWITVSKDYDIKFIEYAPVTGIPLGEVPWKTERFRKAVSRFYNYQYI